MPSASDIRAGGAFTELYTKNGPLYAGLKSAEARIKGFSAKATQIAQSMTRFTAVVASPFVIGLKAASDMQESMSKFDVVYGENAEAMKKWGDEYGKQVGRSKQQIADFLAGNQDLFVPMGFDSKSAEEISKTLTTLAVDLGSFNNKADADVMNDLQAAMTGSGEVMKKYGVILSEAAVKAELLKQGLDPKSVTEAQKAQARLAIILRGTTAAQGDAIRMSGGFANQMKALKASAWDAAGAIGEALLPTVTGALTKVVEIAKAAAVWAAQNATLVRTLAAIVAIVGSVGAGIWAIGAAGTAAATAIGVLTTAMTFMAAHPVMMVVTAVVAATAAIVAFESTARRLPSVMTDVRSKSDEMRASDIKLMEELHKLAGQQSLTTEEMDRAASILDTLQGRYGDLGVTIDRTAGTISGMAEAQLKLNDAMRRATIAQLTAEAKGVEVEIDELNRKRAGFFRQVMQGLGSDYDQTMLDKILAESAKLDAIRQRIEALKGGDMSALTAGAGDSGAPAIAAAVEAGDTEAALAMNEEMLNRIAEARIEQIEDEQLRAEAAINARYDAEIEKAKELGADLALVEQARAAALGTVRGEADKKKQEEAARAAEAKKLSNQQLQDEIAALKIEQSTTSEIDKQKALLELQRSQALRDAASTGQDPDLINQLFDLKIAGLKSASAALKDAQAIFAESGSVGSDAAYKMVMGSFGDTKGAKASQQPPPPKWPDEKSKPTAASPNAGIDFRELIGLTETVVSNTRQIVTNTGKSTIKEAVPPKR